jgi:predicted dehydrogenase
VLGLAVVGLGYVAREVHLPLLRRVPGVEVVGLVDPAPAARARALAESGFGPGYPSIDALLAATRPDGVLVLTPKQIEHFVECVRTRAEPRTSSADAVGTQALMDRLLQAMGLPLEDRPGG